MRGIAAHIDRLVVKAEAARGVRFAKEGPALKRVLWDDVFGRMPAASVPLNARVSRAYQGDGFEGFDVRFDVHEDIFGYGVLLRPLGLEPGG